ncbi:adhesion G protein-coupled receptor G3 isoform X8 [Egretta garzetta]|uniref:adhesion G protein-coupled receptor G3 isoform X8 n=1 Tax=Egretta garzetta TaxID=188379 RepID=UPI00163CBBA4|nr:adhesion G protein-coupled receptor G3 isoform X8 [Egretta garzetta]
MSRLLGTILLLLVLPDAAGGQESCAGLQRGDSQNHCCKMEVLEEPGNWTPSPDLPQHCPELGRSGRPACACLRERWLRLLQSAGPALRGGLAGLKVLLLNVSRAVTQDVLITFSPTEGPRMLNTMEKGKAGKIQLPRELFRSLSSQRVRVVVMVLNTQQLGMFKEANQTGQVLDDTVVGIMVGKTSISGLQDPVRLTFAHGQLPHGITPQCVFWDPSKGQAGGWRNTGCVMQPGDKGTVCSCDHLTFFTLLLNPALDRSTAKGLMAVATVGCWVAMVFSIFTITFCIFLRCRFRSEETLRINLGLHMNLVGSLLLLNLAFLLNSRLSHGSQAGTCKVLAGLTHYCLLCCFTWMALEGCHLYLLFVKVLDHFQTCPGPLHHQLRLLWSHLSLQHGHLRGGDLEELLPAGHGGGAGGPQGLEGGPGGGGALLPAGSHLGPGIPHLQHLLCAHTLPLHHSQLSPRNLHIHLAGCPLLPEDKGGHWLPLPHHQT